MSDPTSARLQRLTSEFVPRLWEILDEYKVVKNIAEFAAEYLEREKRPLRVGIDASYWRRKNVQFGEEEYIKKSQCSNIMSHAVP